MELKTESGVSIIIIDDGSSKVLIFDKSVRVVELNKETEHLVCTVGSRKPQVLNLVNDQDAKAMI